MDVKVIESNLFKKFPELVFGISTRSGGVSPGEYGMNLSISVGDDPENVKQNRKIFFDALGISKELITFQKQIHSDIINYSDKPRHFDGCDAIYTDKKNNFLTVSVADCIPVFLYDPVKEVVAAIHSGWKGTRDKILTKTIDRLANRFGSLPSDLIAFIGPGISKENYEVGEDVASFFSDDTKEKNGDKYHLDLKKDNYLQLIKSGVQESNIEVSELCTFGSKELHSFRRDGNKSGRMFGIIGMK